MKRSLEDWLQAYAWSHQNLWNKRIHYICVPLIMWSILALCWLASPWVILFLSVVSLFFYFSLSIRSGFYMLLVLFLMLLSIIGIQIQYSTYVLLILSVGVFVIAWIFQFIGHHIEKRKPSFFQDLQFLLVGPLWIIHQLLDTSRGK